MGKGTYLGGSTTIKASHKATEAWKAGNTKSNADKVRREKLLDQKEANQKVRQEIRKADRQDAEKLAKRRKSAPGRSKKSLSKGQQAQRRNFELVLISHRRPEKSK
ncbi:MAG: hypothetical protein KIT15_12280 [Xanthobacteraceae bacterium]|nr:hypothetical protein [Xanthobacteraceae bacterium]MCW5675345.1 hypothetical protein [Xanthobacteraceae bacterium]MCW5676612.1 hypothetical protein [Xanthobacteraceae bacterium]